MPKANADRLQKVSSRLGEVALDPALWPELMEEICQAVGAHGAALLQTDNPTPDTPVTESVRDAFAAYFRDGWHKHDLRERVVPLHLAGHAVCSDQDITSPAEMRAHPYFNELIYPVGLHWFMCVGFQSGTALSVMSFHRTTRQGPFQASEGRLLAQLVPHLTQAASLSKAVGRTALASSTNALNAVRHAAIAINHGGLVLEANAAMNAMLDEHIGIDHGRLWLSDPEARRSLERLIEELAMPGDGTLAGTSPIVIRRAAAPPAIMRCLPVPPAARSPFLGARAILTFTPLEPRPRPDPSLLAQALGLTRMEARIAAALADGENTEAVAEELSITRETVRNHLKSIFLKTGTHRQGALVALLARL